MKFKTSICVKITKDHKTGQIKKEVVEEIPGKILTDVVKKTTTSGVSNMTKEILRKLKEH